MAFMPCFCDVHGSILNVSLHMYSWVGGYNENRNTTITECPHYLCTVGLEVTMKTEIQQSQNVHIIVVPHSYGVPFRSNAFTIMCNFGQLSCFTVQLIYKWNCPACDVSGTFIRRNRKSDQHILPI